MDEASKKWDDIPRFALGMSVDDVITLWDCQHITRSEARQLLGLPAEKPADETEPAV